MDKKRKIVDAKEDADKRISAVKLEGNKTFTQIEKAIDMTKKVRSTQWWLNPKDVRNTADKTGW
ncbi:MAG: hypothetical protein WKF34_07220 [Pyrinomonadaceae bacterium]